MNSVNSAEGKPKSVLTKMESCAHPLLTSSFNRKALYVSETLSACECMLCAQCLWTQHLLFPHSYILSMHFLTAYISLKTFPDPYSRGPVKTVLCYLSSVEVCNKCHLNLSLTSCQFLFIQRATLLQINNMPRWNTWGCTF